VTGNREQGLVVEPLGRAEQADQPIDLGPGRLARGVRVEFGYAFAQAHGSIGHRSHDPALARKTGAEGGQLDPGQDRQQDRVPGRAWARSPGATSSSFCGLTPSRTRAGASPDGGPVSTRTPGAAARPLGRITVKLSGAIPASSQPASIAPAMLPQPISQVGEGRSTSLTPTL
jgi:hypothetical protein